MPRATKPPPALPLPVTGPPTPVTSFLLSSALERGVGGLLPFGDRMRSFHSKENIRNFSPPGASPSLGFGENGRWLCAPFCQPQLLQASTLPLLLLTLAGDRHLQTCPKTWRYRGSWGFVLFQSTWCQGGREAEMSSHEEKGGVACLRAQGLWASCQRPRQVPGDWGWEEEKGCGREHPVPLLPEAVPTRKKGETLTQAVLPGQLLVHTGVRGQESKITV